MKNLVIVESPAKSKTIEKYLGNDYNVVSSKGHIRDLATTGKFGLGVDIENDFKPTYVAIKGKSKDIKSLKKLTKEADRVYLATDPDREGEAISWHLYDELGLSDDKYDRVVFNEITKNVVIDAIKKPRKIDYDLVKSQETRRILDRIIGFRLSKLMRSKTGGKSAGRVQSVALKLIVDREREILAFKEEEYWTIEASFGDFNAELEKFHGKKVTIKSEDEADEIIKNLNKAFQIDDIKEKELKRKSKEVFKTSTLQQLASTKLNFSASKTMKIAQKLYEGVDLGSETVGLITYMRTDSVRISPVFIKETYEYIENNYGKEYVGSVKVRKSNENIQDAHEGIRPTSINRTPSMVKKYLTPDEYKLYNLIYLRALASLMADAVFKNTTLILMNNGYTFKATGSVNIFDGYLKIYKGYEEEDESKLPNLKDYNSTVLASEEIKKLQHFTKPASRYTESSLIKELESLGIGRPSTYATIMQTIKDRGYVSIEEKKFHPTEIGIETTDKLQEFFSNLVNVKYTANMENDLDKIANHELDNVKVLRDFYNEFEPLVEKAFTDMEKKEATKTGELCPECGSELVIRNGKYGSFTACSNYPACKYIKKDAEEVKKIMDCPKCDGAIVEKKTRRNKIFYGCSNYPKCKLATWYLPVGICPECKGLLVQKKEDVTCDECGYKK